MDKNFIRIDDLVRQRLTGGEESERSGAWMNMRDLLDREMPQERRIGIFYWRRIFNAVAVMSLIGTVCIGSYEVMSAYNGGFGQRAAVAALTNVPSANNEPTGNYELSGGQASGSEQGASGAGSEGASAAGTYEEGAMSGGGADDGNDASGNNAVVGNAHTDETQGNNGKGNSTAHKNGNANGVNNTQNIGSANRNNAAAQGNRAGNESANRNAQRTAAENKVARNNVTGNVANDANSVNSSNSNNRSNSINNNSSNRKNSSSLKGSNGAVTNNSGNSQLAAAVENRNAQAGQSSRQHQGTTASTLANSSNTQGKVAGRKATRRSSYKAGSRQGEVGTDGAIAMNTRNNGNGSHSKNMVLNSSTGNGTSKAKDDAVVLPGKLPVAEATAGQVKPEQIQPALAVPTPVRTNTAAPISSNGTTTAAKSGASNQARNYGTGGTPVKNNVVDNRIKNKHIITRVVVHQSTIKISENEFAEKLDTISIEKVNMELGLKPLVDNTHSGNARKHAGTEQGSQGMHEEEAQAGPATAARHSSSSGKKRGVANVSAAAGNSNEAAIADEAEILPSSAAKASEEAATASTHTGGADTKIKPAATKTKSGMSFVKKLSAAFNDVKQNATNTQFAGGITAGINGNFFGPSSFKGFQFGITGNFIFNETWNLMTEMKYFHRLNNNKEIEDNYYVYTQVGNQYRKDLLLNSYSFSALHSIEVPVAIRYTKGNFNFYTGGNFLYSFSLNTGAATMPAVGVPSTFVNEEGNDNAPKFKEEDFRSRFGLGYLLGFSYQLAPNASIDLRSVQTVWDNAATTGAKSISGQLYKTPSLQLSIMYRLGGNRSKD